MRLSDTRKGEMLAISSGFLYGFIGYFGLYVIHANISASTMLFWRFLIASLCVLPFVLCTKHNRTYRAMDLFIAFMTGVCFYGLSTLLYFYASLHVGSGLAMVIFFTYPAFVLLLNVLLKGHTIERLHYIAMLLILAGMLLLVDLSLMHLDAMGIMLGTLSALFYAGYMVTSKESPLPSFHSTLMVSLGCMVTALVISLMEGRFEIITKAHVWLHLFGIAVIASAIPIVLLLKSMDYISAAKASILSVLEPVFVVVFGVLLLGESITLKQFIGIVIILIGATSTLLFEPGDEVRHVEGVMS